MNCFEEWLEEGGRPLLFDRVYGCYFICGDPANRSSHPRNEWVQDVVTATKSYSDAALIDVLGKFIRTWKKLPTPWDIRKECEMAGILSGAGFVLTRDGYSIKDLEL